MNPGYFFVNVVLIAVSVNSQWKEKTGRWDAVRIIRTSPNSNWNKAWGLGNGRLAARIMCNATNERIYLNDNTFWPGYPRNYSDPNALNVLKKVRELLLSGKNAEADKEARNLQSFHCFPYGFPGNIYLDLDENSSYTNYKNILNLDSAIVQLQFTIGTVNHKRDIFISYPDQVLVLRHCVDKKGALSMSIRMDTKDNAGKSLKQIFSVEGNNTLAMKTYADYAYGHFTGDTSQMKCDIHVKALLSGGTISSNESSLKIKNADTLILLLSIATSYNGPFKHPGKEGLDQTQLCKDFLENALSKSYQELLLNHVKDYQKIFRKFWVELNGGSPGQNAIDFQYARFELTQMSRGAKGYPPMLKGIWNDLHCPEFYGHYTINSEGEKNFFFAEAANLGEMLLPMTNMVEELAVNGTKTAKVNYNCRGWCAHHNTDLWKHTSMVGEKNYHPYWVNWTFGGAFLASLVSDHYKFTGDKNFLREHAYPVMKGVAEFCLDYLIDNGKGYLVPAPSSSPENMYRFNGTNDVAVCLGSTCDLSHVRQAFLDVMDYSKILDVDNELRKEIDSAYKRLLPYKIGKNGKLQEWCEDYEENEPQHRHASHLMGAFPLMTITKQGTPEIWKAAKKSMELRGGGGWLPAPEGMWARFLEGNKTNSYMYSPFGPRRWVGENWVGFPELFIQSHAGELELLPALPSAFTSGKISGLCGRTGYEVDIEWSNSSLKKATIRSLLGTTPVVRIRGELIPEPLKDPRITIEYLASPIRKVNGQSQSIKPVIEITRTRFWSIKISHQGNFSASVINMRGQIVESISGNGSFTFRISPETWIPGLYILRITAGNGKVSLVEKINNVNM